MKLLIDASLSEPPSSKACFRDVTLYANCFLKYDILVECEEIMIDEYWSGMKKNYLLDFVEEILKKNEETGISIRPSGGTINTKILNEFNYLEVINKLKIISKN